MKWTLLNIAYFDLGDGGKEKHIATHKQQQQHHHPFSEDDCNPSIGWRTLHSHSTWVVQTHK